MGSKMSGISAAEAGIPEYRILIAENMFLDRLTYGRTARELEWAP